MRKRKLDRPGQIQKNLRMPLPEPWMPPRRARRIVWLLGVSALLGCSLAAPVGADELADVEEDSGVESSDQPIALELAQGIQLLSDQIAQQQQLLDSAQTDREKQLIRNHLRSLQKERRSLESLLHKLVGPNVDVLEAAREQQAETHSQRYEKTLEKEGRQPEP
jgi:hypothetical protein